MTNGQGILYNRFTSGFTLLPYSDPSKIITYATYDNFDASSSTWGDETAPIRNIGGWRKDTDAQGFVSFVGSNAITNTSALGNAFTIYEVLKHVDYPQSIVDNTYNLIIDRGSASSNEKLFSPYYGSNSYSYACETSFGQVIHFSVGSLSSLDQLHVTAAAYEYTTAASNDRQSKVGVYCNYDYSGVGPATADYATVDRIWIAGKNITTRCYKFIAVVAENEDNIYIGNRSIVEYNMAVLNSYFGVNYPTPIH